MRAEDYMQMAYQSILANDFEQAIRWFKRAIQEEPENGELHYRLSITYARSDKLDKAIRHAARAIVLSPNQQVYILHYQRLEAKDLTRRAVHLLQQRQDDDTQTAQEAADLLERAVKLDPLSANIHVWLALAYGELGHFHQALACVWEASALLQDDYAAVELKKMEQRFKNNLNQTSKQRIVRDHDGRQN
ncbi:hypothetical protein DCC85_12660 [Paenibacillus sp. CAA11]|uniref:tetratricopeptide repeat protein n=1 Tax=Paenibacillus sp. CAA11 TaxID=1532905 RepID=UPI000D34673C|nr:tetratricopeptide repeat protein [Paenibacillus sp. CAA11]AWB44987.1 hypothetical protein DCC85_12660 [Paenibacillus sp. CAA11]